MFNRTKVAVVVSSALFAGSAAIASTVSDQQWAAPAEQSKIAVQPNLKWSNKLNQVTKKQRAVFSPEQDVAGTHTYIVQLNDAPLSAYNGSIAGHTATKQLVQNARTNNKPLDLKQAPLAQYQNYLKQQQTSVVSNALRQQGLSIQSDRSFTVALNGFVAKMTQEQAQRLAKVSGIKHIKRSQMKQLQTFNTIEETGAQNVWTAPASGTGKNLGEGVVVGIIDTGINTDHPSFAAMGADGYQHINPLGSEYLGDCKADASLCNSKLIGVYSYPEITSTYTDPVFTETRPENGEDYNNHGSHVAGTAAGNIIYDQTYLMAEAKNQSSGIATNLIFPQVSGMAPHANIIAYQACLPGGGGDPYAGCPETAILSAIEQATIDNVDVINFSIGGLEQNPWADPIEQAFFNAAKSGIFVAAAAGNSGPDLMTADHSSPWLTTVAAHTADSRVHYANKKLINMAGGDTQAPADITGKSITFEELSGLVVNAGDFENPNERYEFNIANCDSEFPEGTFDLDDDLSTPDIDESAQNVIVVCKRSSNPIYFKGVNVEKGGAEGLIIYNQSSYYDSLEIPDVTHPLPAIHITHTAGNELVNWLETGNAHTATITGTQAQVEDLAQPLTAYFSSRGPSYFGLNTLFVDLAAPGVDIYAAASDDHPFTSNPSASTWMSMSGTSMASPHVAGAAALLRQSHPQWSPLAIQSALLMTASNDLKNSKFLSNYSDSGYNSALQDVGAGRMHVDLADNVGLVLDESLENMQAADPNLGGFVENLNTAYMVNTDCVDECSWLRTFTATKDGTWQSDTQTSIGNFDITVSPAEFSVKKGETISLVITAKSQRTSAATSYVDLTGNQGEVILTSDSSPTLALPVWTYNGDTGLPDFVKVDAHRTSGTAQIGPMITGDISDFASNNYGFVKGEVTNKVLSMDSTSNNPFDDLSQVLVSMQTIPEGSPLAISHVISDDYERVLLFMGQDLNGDGKPSEDEMLCMSTVYDEKNFCAIHDPQAGDYWTVASSVLGGTDSENRNISVASAVLKEDNGNISVSAPEQIAGYQDYTIDVNYTLPEMEIGDYYFGGIDIGSNPNDIGNIGFVPIVVSQIDEDVTFTASKNTAKVGDIIDFEISVIANNEEQARDFALDVTLPEGIQLVPDSIVTSQNTPGEATVEENTLHLAGVQATTKETPRSYKVTTSNDNAMCSLDAASSPYPGYLDLRPLGWRTLENVEGNYRDYFDYSLKDLMQTNEDVSIPFFNTNQFTSLKISPAGAVYWGDRRMPSGHMAFPNGSGAMPSPDNMIAPYWVGDNKLTRVDSTSGNHALNAGVTPTYTVDREWLVLEWDNVERERTEGQLVDFEMFLRTNINYEPGEFEMMFAYDNLNMVDEKGSIGFKTYAGRIIVDGDIPINTYNGESIAFNNLTDVLEDELVVCMDYSGPEESQFNVKFQGYVTQLAAAQSHIINLNNGLVGAEDEQLSVVVDVTGNIDLTPLANLTVDAGQPISFSVNYTDKNKVSNIIELEGEHFTYDVSGGDSGSIVTITPDINYAGELAVTAHVKDSVTPTDMASETFILTVNQVNSAPTIVVEAQSVALGETASLDASKSFDAHDELTFMWEQVSGPAVSLTNKAAAIASFTANELGDYIFNVTVSDGQFTVAKEVKLSVTGETPPVIENTAPVAIATGANVTTGEVVTLDASQSKDAESDELTYNWEQTAGPQVSLSNSESSIATFTSTEAGIYSFIVTVNDGELEGKQSLNVSVDDAQEPEAETESSGSTSGILLLLLGVPALLRRKFKR